MKKYFYLCLALLAMTTGLASCSSDKDEAPQINFTQTRYQLTNDTIEVKIEADEAPTTDVSVPFTLSGTAKSGEDYTISANAFTLKAGQKEASVKLAGRNSEAAAKSITMTMTTVPDGYKVGTMAYTEIELAGGTWICSFDKFASSLSLSSSYGITLTRANGKPYEVADNTTFNVEVDPSSTAVEGTDFSFANGKTITVEKGKSTGSITLNYIKKEDNKDKIVLNLKPASGFEGGENTQITITIVGALYFDGTWVYDSNNYDWWASSWAVDTSTLPQCSAKDSLVFDGDTYQEYKLTPKFVGGLKNYFGTVATTAKFVKERTKEVWQEKSTSAPYYITVADLNVDNINVAWSAKTSKKRTAVVSFRMMTDDKGRQLLECTINDYEPVDFMTDIFSMFKDLGDSPLMLEAPLRYYFVRAAK